MLRYPASENARLRLPARSFVVAFALVAAVLGSLGPGAVPARRAEAAVTNIFVINANVAGALAAANGVTCAATDPAIPCDLRNPADLSAFTAKVSLADASDASGAQVGDAANIGLTFVVVTTDGSGTDMVLNANGLAVDPTGQVVGVDGLVHCPSNVSAADPPLATTADEDCDGDATTNDQRVVFTLSGRGSNSIGAVLSLVAAQDSVSIATPTLTVVGPAHDVTLSLSKLTVQEGAPSCGFGASLSSPTDGNAVAVYTDINGAPLVGYSPTLASSAPSTAEMADAAGSGAASQTVMTMRQPDGTTLGGADRYCGLTVGSASISATPTTAEDALLGVDAGFSRTQTLTVAGVPATIALTASPAAILCDGVSTSTVTADVTDSDGNNVVDGTPVTFSVVALGTANPVNTTTTDGTATSVITPLSGVTMFVEVVVTSFSANAPIDIDCVRASDGSAAPIDITALPFTDARSTTGFTTEPGETLPCGNMGATAWYRLALPAPMPVGGRLIVDTAGSDFNTALAVYSDGAFSSPPGALTEIGCDASGGDSSVVFTASSPGTYYIQAGGAAGAMGNLVLHVGCVDDTDCDRLTDIDEVAIGTDPNVADSDGDGLTDGAEVHTYHTDPLVADTDGDGLSDGDEVIFTLTDPFAADTDADGCGDGRELGGDHRTGGQRDPLDPWDFFDVTGDGSIDLADTIAVLGAFGKAPGSAGYDALFDRYVPDAAQPWRTARAIDGSGIDLEDAIASLLSFGDDCG